jgi:hypothetical protein
MAYMTEPFLQAKWLNVHASHSIDVGVCFGDEVEFK